MIFNTVWKFLNSRWRRQWRISTYVVIFFVGFTFRSLLSQNKDIQKCNFHYKTVRRFFTEIAGGHVLSKCPKERHSPPWNIKFSICFQGGDCFSLGHLLTTWRTEKIPYAKLTWSEISVCTSSVLLSKIRYYKDVTLCENYVRDFFYSRHFASKCQIPRHQSLNTENATPSVSPPFWQ